MVASFPAVETTVSFIFAFLDVKNGVGGIALREDALLLGVIRYRPSAIDCGKKSLRIKLNSVGRYTFSHDSTPNLRTKTLKRWFHSWMLYVNRDWRKVFYGGSIASCSMLHSF
jgi:hypothetical protein